MILQKKRLERRTSRLIWSLLFPARTGCEMPTRTGSVFERKLGRRSEKEASAWKGP